MILLITSLKLKKIREFHSAAINNLNIVFTCIKKLESLSFFVWSKNAEFEIRIWKIKENSQR